MLLRPPSCSCRAPSLMTCDIESWLAMPEQSQTKNASNASDSTESTCDSLPLPLSPSFLLLLNATDCSRPWIAFVKCRNLASQLPAIPFSTCNGPEARKMDGRKVRNASRKNNLRRIGRERERERGNKKESDRRKSDSDLLVRKLSWYYMENIEWYQISKVFLIKFHWRIILKHNIYV